MLNNSGEAPLPCGRTWLIYKYDCEQVQIFILIIIVCILFVVYQLFINTHPSLLAITISAFLVSWTLSHPPPFGPSLGKKNQFPFPLNYLLFNSCLYHYFICLFDFSLPLPTPYYLWDVDFIYPGVWFSSNFPSADILQTSRKGNKTGGP